MKVELIIPDASLESNQYILQGHVKASDWIRVDGDDIICFWYEWVHIREIEPRFIHKANTMSYLLTSKPMIEPPILRKMIGKHYKYNIIHCF